MNEKRIWDFLMEKIGNPCGVAGLMGNLYAESGLNPINLQNTYERKLGMTDEAYTKAVDSGKYKANSFIHDSAGYGLAQWTYHKRKEKLLLFAVARKASIGDLDMQLDFLMKELDSSYKGVLKALCEAKSVRKASDIVLTQYERPKNQGDSVKKKRASFGQRYFDQFANQTDEENEEGEDMVNTEAENAWDVPEDMIFTLDANGNPVRLEVEDDADDQA